MSGERLTVEREQELREQNEDTEWMQEVFAELDAVRAERDAALQLQAALDAANAWIRELEEVIYFYKLYSERLFIKDYQLLQDELDKVKSQNEKT